MDPVVLLALDPAAQLTIYVGSLYSAVTVQKILWDSKVIVPFAAQLSCTLQS
jgi:hypothetical protein